MLCSNLGKGNSDASDTKWQQVNFQVSSLGFYD